MITRTDAEEIAAGWARRDSLLEGAEFEPVVDEFDLGFVVWTRRRVPDRSILGGGTTVIDRATGRLSTWPSVPTATVAQMYREQHAAIVAPVKTADPELELRRNARRRPTPTVAAHVTLDGRLIIARGVKGDQGLNHHPLVAQWLAGNAPGELVRGAERHAEIVALSDALHEVDRLRAAEGLAPVTLAEARHAMRQRASFESFFVRERGDKLGGVPADLCASCALCLVHFALVPQIEAHAARTVEIEPRPVPQPGRFPEDVAWALAEGGWTVEPEDMMERFIAIRLAETAEKAGVGLESRLEPFEAAARALASMPFLSCHRRGPGLVHRIQPFALVGEESAHCADTLAEFGRLVGARVFPIGCDVYTSDPIVIDERGRMFALDQAGEWFLGDSFDQGLVNLVAGGYQPRVRDDGTW